jgi:hypothetical protein
MVLVEVDPGAGIAIDARNANRQALEDVENALESRGVSDWSGASTAPTLSSRYARVTGRLRSQPSAVCQSTTGQWLN